MIELTDVTKRYGGTVAVDHLSIEVQPGEVTGFRGPDGAGKSASTDVANRRSGGFSLGMGQRLAIATALLGDPATLLLDEPVNGLDPKGIQWIRELLRSLANEGRSILVSSHLMSEMALAADRLVVVGRGRLIAQGTVADVVQGAATGSVRVDTAEPHRLASLLVSDGAAVTNAADGTLTPWSGFAVLLAWAALTLAVGGALLVRRDA